jgi:hypothetical protein
VILAAALLLLLLSTSRAESPSGGAPGPARGAKAAEVSTISPETPPAPDQLRARAAKRAATAAATAAPALPSGTRKPTDVHTALAGTTPGPATLEARWRAKEAAAMRAPSSGSRSHGVEGVLGPLPRPEWVLDLLGRKPKAASLASGPMRSGAPATTHVGPTDASVRAGTRGPKQPEKSTIERGPEQPTDVELAKRRTGPIGGGPR